MFHVFFLIEHVSSDNSKELFIHSTRSVRKRKQFYGAVPTYLTKPQEMDPERCATDIWAIYNDQPAEVTPNGGEK